MVLTAQKTQVELESSQAVIGLLRRFLEDRIRVRELKLQEITQLQRKLQDDIQQVRRPSLALLLVSKNKNVNICMPYTLT